MADKICPEALAPPGWEHLCFGTQKSSHALGPRVTFPSPGVSSSEMQLGDAATSERREEAEIKRRVSAN